MRFPSSGFDEAVSALCHGTVSAESLVALHNELRSNSAALDEYLWQVELHARLITSAFSLRGPGRNFEESIGRGDTSRSKARRQLRPMWLACLVAAVLIVLSSTITYLVMTASRMAEPTLATSDDPANATVRELTPGTLPSADPPPSGPSASLLGMTLPNVRFSVAAKAPVLVGTGRMEPIHLGAYVPYAQGGDTLHIWNWSESPLSRVLKDVRLFEDQRFALSPDGRLLVWSSGEILDLETMERRKIDLGGVVLLQGSYDERLRRIRDLQFSPDGGRLAVLVSKIETHPSEHPLRKHDFSLKTIVQIVEFPTGTLLCEFPTSALWTLRIAFSADGERVVSANPPNPLDQQVVERDATTGAIRREYEPRVKQHAYSIAFSPDGALVAVFEGAGAVLLWDAATGELKHRIAAVRNESNSHALSFSPDGKYLAVDSTQRTYVVDVSSGRLVSTIPQSIAGDFRWSADGDLLTVLTRHAHGGPGFGGTFNVYPAIHEWTWRTATLVRSITGEPPSDRK